ncbi:hypothetical protein QF042_002153 [Pedobacter sp. W3I1]|nr:hypothetical protein [Pedobacter sp. W3I1]
MGNSRAEITEELPKPAFQKNKMVYGDTNQGNRV